MEDLFCGEFFARFPSLFLLFGLLICKTNVDEQLLQTNQSQFLVVLLDAFSPHSFEEPIENVLTQKKKVKQKHPCWKQLLENHLRIFDELSKKEDIALIFWKTLSVSLGLVGVDFPLPTLLDISGFFF